MTDYSKMSDFEISTKVGDSIGVEWASLDENYHPLSIWKGGSLSIFDPCNNPADAWPIIYANGISMGIYGYGEWGAGTINHTYIDGTNPLRAAMIVFLMMQDSSNANPI